MLKVVCIGAGRLAHQLMPAIEEAGCAVIQVYNRTLEKADSIASKLKSSATTDNLSEINLEADLYFIAVADDQIRFIADQLFPIIPSSAICMHCSGSLEVDVLPFKRRGAFYPLQSFSINHDVSWRWIPLIITTEHEDIWLVLDEIAGAMSSSVYRMTDAQKSVLHVAAVFTNNFSNHMLTLAESICQKNNLPFEILKPLILETFSKAILSGPKDSQTGPAIRGDQTTINKHLQLLKGDADLTAVYKTITESIQRRLGD